MNSFKPRPPLKQNPDDFREVRAAINKWTTTEQRMIIAKEFGVYTLRQVHRICSGHSKNFEILTALIEKAEANKKLFERAHNLMSDES